MRPSPLPVLVAFALVLAGCTSTATTVKTSYYSVSGTTSEEIDRELRAKGPLNGHALAVASIRFVPADVFQQQTETGCRFVRAGFRVDAAITLPRWQNRHASRDRALRNAWDALSSYARLHEETHVRIAEKHALRLEEAILALKPRPTCAALDASAKPVVERIAREHNREQLAFDRAEQKRLAKIFGS